MLSWEIRVSSNQVSYPEREYVILCAVHGTFKRKLGSSLCYHMRSLRTCFCVCICLIFAFAYLAFYCFCAMLFSVSHFKHSEHFLLLLLYAWRLPKTSMLYLRCVYCLLFSKTRYITQYLNCGFCRWTNFCDLHILV